MEPIIGFVMAIVLMGVVIPIYLRFFAAEGVRNKEFERWCRTRPVVVAIRCRAENAIEVHRIVRQEIEPKKEVINSAGRFPWQHYVFRVECARLSDEVVVISVVGCRPARVRDEHPDLAKSVEAIGRAAGDRVEEVWLHGQLHAVRRVLGAERGMAAWVGEFDGEGHPDVTGMIGQPPWLVETLARV